VPPIRVPIVMRSIGAFMVAVAVAGSFVAFALGDPRLWVGLAVMTPWSAPSAIYGIRLIRAGVFSSAGELLIRNGFRSYRVPWDDVLDVRFQRLTSLPTANYPFLWSRWGGVVRLQSGARIAPDATESFAIFIYGSIFSQSKRAAATKVEEIRRAVAASQWQFAAERGDPPPLPLPPA
jgi:PH (Pleckstrin Homology) domain-containing protein